MDKRTIVENYFRQGYNCAQAVVLAYQEELGLDQTVLAKMASSFGGGLGRMREVCGAVSGAAIVLGALRGYSDPQAKEEKTAQYKLIQNLASAFKERNRSIICKDLLGVDCDGNPTATCRTEEFYKKRPCLTMVGDAAEIVQSLLAK